MPIRRIAPVVVTVALGLAALVAAGPAAAGPADAAVGAATPVATGSVSGAVTGPAGFAARGVTVAAYTDEVAASVRTTRTDAAGRYTLAGLPGNSRVAVCLDPSTSPVAPATGWVAECLPAPFSAYSLAGVYVPAGGGVTGIDAVLRVGGAVSGTVVANPGTPLGGVAVTATAYGLDVDPSTADRGATRAAAAGVLRPSAARGVIPPGTSAPTSETLPGARSSGIVHVATTTAADGTYRLVGLPASRDWEICFDGVAATGGYVGGYRTACHTASTPAGYQPVAVTAGATVTGVDETLPRAGTVTGRVTLPGGTGAAGATVVVASAVDGRTVATATTDANGNYRRPGLAGQYTVCASPAPGVAAPGLLDRCVGGPPGGAPVTGGLVTVMPEQVTTASVALTAGGAVRVVVSHGAGQVVGGVRVHLVDGPTVATGTTTADGSVLLPALVPGRYRVCAGDAADPTARWTPSCSLPLEVGAGLVVPVAVAVTLGAVSTGHLQGPDGTPVPDADVRITSAVVAGATVGVRSGPDGGFSASGLPAGPVTICADQPTQTSGPGYFLPGCVRGTAGAPGATVDTVVTMTPYAGIAGTVTSAGRPLADVTVDVGQVSVRSDASGHYGLSGLYVDPTQGVSRATVCAVPSPTPSPQGPVRTCVTSPPLTRGVVTTADVDLAAPGSAVSGRLTVAGSGDPAAGVKVLLGRGGPVIGITDADGRYTVGGLAPGQATLCFDASYGYQVDLLPVCWDGRPASYRVPTPITLVAGRTRAGLDLSLTRTGSLVGTVASAAGVPLGGAVVALYDSTGRSPLTQTVAAAGGRYVFPGLFTNGYRVCVQSAPLLLVGSPTGYLQGCSGGVATPASATTVTVTNGATTTADLVLPPAAGIHGRVVDAAGHPVAGALVTAGSTPVAATTAADGSYRAAGLPAKRVSVCVSDLVTTATDPGPLPGCGTSPVLVAGATTTFDVLLAPAGGIAGRVRLVGGAPVAGVGVGLYRGAVYLGIWHTDATGRYRLPGLASGSDYTVCFDGTSRSQATCFDRAPDRASATPIAVTAGSYTTADAVVRPAGTLTGVVRDRSGHPLRSVFMSVTTSTGVAAGVTETRDDGSFSSDSLPPGRTRVCASTPPVGPGYGGSSTTGYVSACATVDLAAGPNTHDFALFPADAVSGTVTGPGGGAVARAVVTVYDAATSQRVGDTRTDLSGVYVAASLPPGTYRVCFSAERSTTPALPYGYASQCWNHRTDGGGTLVSVTGYGQVTSGIGAALTAGGGLTGRVTDTAGAPLQDAVVELLAGSGYSYVPDTQFTDTAGRYSFTGLPTASVRQCWQTTQIDGGPAVGYASGCRSVVTTAGVQTTAPDLALGVGARIAGTITNYRNVNDLRVDVTGPAGWTIGVGVDAAGHFTIRGLPTGAVTVTVTSGRTSATASAAITLAAGDDRTGVDIAFDGAGG